MAGQLAVRSERQDATSITWLSGSLDQATVTLLDRELQRRPVDMTRRVVDLTDLEFIDSPDLDALVGIDWRASQRGDQLSFRYGPHVAQRPIELTRSIRRRSCWAACTTGESDQNFYLALAMARVDVDHQPPFGDRPEAG